MTKKFRSFKEARKFVQSLNLKSRTEWEKYRKSGNKPDDISSHPDRTYKKEWKGYGDFLGTGTIATYDMEFVSFEEFQKFLKYDLKSEGIKTGIENGDIVEYSPFLYFHL